MMNKIIFLSHLISFVYSASEIVVTNHPKCTNMAKRYIQNFNVTPPELAIIISVCEGIVNPQDAGLGGGFQATIFNGYCGKTLYVNSREKAPELFTEKSDEDYGNIGVPATLKGYEYLYGMEMCGIKSALPWKDLFTENIKLAEDGWSTTKTTFNVMHRLNTINHTIEMTNEKQNMRNPTLASTLQRIADEGPSSSLYKPDGYLHKKVLEDLRPINNVMQSSDLLNYDVEIKHPFSTHYFLQYKIATTRIPGSGAVFIFGCKIVESVYEELRKLSKDHRMLFMYHVLRYMYSLKPYLRSSKVSVAEIYENSEVIARLILENLDNGWIQRPLKKFGNYKIKGDLLKQNPRNGTTNIIIKRGKYAITMTSTINWSWGCKMYSKRLGIFYNNQLNDFDDVGTPNGPRPLKVPQSAISATILYSERGNPVFQIGSAGGSKIIGAVFNTFFNYFVNKMTLENANKAPRCIPKYENFTETVYCERDVRDSVKEMFENLEVSVKYSKEGGYAAVTASSTIKGHPEASFDIRRGGKVYVNKRSEYD